MDDGRTTDGRTTEHGYTISSPCEPDGSGELTIIVSPVIGGGGGDGQSVDKSVTCIISSKYILVAKVVNLHFRRNHSFRTRDKAGNYRQIFRTHHLK